MVTGPASWAERPRPNRITRLAIESSHIALSKLPLQHIRRRSFRAERGLAHIAHVVDMKVNEFAEGPEARNSRLTRYLAAVDLTFSIFAQSRADVATLAADLNAPRARREFVKWPFSCALRVHSDTEFVD